MWIWRSITGSFLVLGNTQASFLLVVTGRGGSNLITTSLFDVGLTGTIFLVLFVGLYLRTTLVVVRAKHVLSTLATSYSEFALAGFLYILLETMVNNMFRYGLVWLHLAVMAVVIDAWKRSRHKSSCAK